MAGVSLFDEKNKKMVLITRPWRVQHHKTEQLIHNTMEQITPTIQRRGLTMETDAQELAVSLKTYRVRNGYTLPQLGKMWGTSRYTLMRIEAAKHVSWTTMYKVANQLIQAIQNEQH